MQPYEHYYYPANNHPVIWIVVYYDSITPFVLEIIVASIEAKDRIDLSKHIIVFTTVNGGWFGWLYGKKQIYPTRFCNCAKAAIAMRDVKDEEVADCFIGSAGQLILSPETIVSNEKE